jgi:dTDP-4-dehydrorhamnose reductase
VDACEDDPAGTLRSNVLGPVVLADACRRRGIHLTHLSSGCVYTGDNDGRGWSEEDAPTFHGSLYARSKIAAEAALRPYDALQLRLRMPISSRPHPRNLLTKLLRFPSVVSVPNSVTVLDDALPVMATLIERGATGVWNVVNEGEERHDEVLALYRALVDPSVSVVRVEPSVLRERLRVGRSDCLLSTAKLRAAGLALPPLERSLPGVCLRYGESLSRGTRPG